MTSAYPMHLLASPSAARPAHPKFPSLGSASLWDSREGLSSLQNKQTRTIDTESAANHSPDLEPLKIQLLL